MIINSIKFILTFHLFICAFSYATLNLNFGGGAYLFDGTTTDIYDNFVPFLNGALFCGEIEKTIFKKNMLSFSYNYFKSDRSGLLSTEAKTSGNNFKLYYKFKNNRNKLFTGAGPAIGVSQETTKWHTSSFSLWGNNTSYDGADKCFSILYGLQFEIGFYEDKALGKLCIEILGNKIIDKYRLIDNEINNNGFIIKDEDLKVIIQIYLGFPLFN